MKKIAVLLILALALSLCGCGLPGSPAAPGAPSARQTAPQTQTDAPAPAGTVESAETPDVPAAPELTPEEAFAAMIPGEYRLINFGAGGDHWGDPFYSETERDRLIAAEPCLTMNEDGTGTLVFDNESHAIGWRFDAANIHYSKTTGLPGSYTDDLLVDGEAIPFSFARRLLTMEYQGWIAVYTTMNEEEYAEYLASFDDRDRSGWTLGEPIVCNAAHRSFQMIHMIVPVTNSGDQTLYLADLNYTLYAPDGVVVADRQCYGRNPEVLLPGETGCFVEWLSPNYVAEGYRDLTAAELRVEISNVNVYTYNEEFVHRLPLTDIVVDLEDGSISGTVTNDLNEMVIGYLHEQEHWTTAHYFYQIRFVCYDRDGAILSAGECNHTQSMDPGDSVPFSERIEWLPEGRVYSDIDRVALWAFILEYETTYDK